MAWFATALSMLCCFEFFVCSQCQSFLNLAEISKTEQIIQDNTFYPPLNKDSSQNADDRKPLVFGLIMSFGGSFDSSGAVPGVRVALDRINSDPALLPGYTLHYALSDSRCHRPQAIRALFNQVPFTEPKRIALIGGGCSIASESTAEISHHFNLMQISCATATPVLSDRERFPNYFQFLPSFAEFAQTYVGIIKEFNWRHVVILLQNENIYTMTIDKLKELLTKENITYRTDIFHSRAGLQSLDRKPFSDPDERIYIIASYEPYARELLCEAYHRNVRYPTHLLLTYHWYSPQWWLVEDQDYTCSGEEREQVLYRTLSATIFSKSFGESNANTSMNITEVEFLQQLARHLNSPPFNFSLSPSTYQCHDATWALAWSLDKILKAESNDITDLSSLNYTSEVVTKEILKYMNDSFIGITGNVAFDENGIRKINKLLVFQYRNNATGSIENVFIGSVEFVDGGYDLQYFPNESIATLWPNELVPYDGMPMEQIDTVPVSLVVIIFLLAAAGITFTVICLVFNFVFSNKRIIQISRPRLNYLIILGAVLFYVSIIPFSIPTTNETVILVMVKTRSWLLSLGFSFFYGTIIMKMFRIYYIVHNPLPNKNIQDWVLAVGVVVFVVIDILLLVLNLIISEALGQSELSVVLNRDNPRTVTGALKVSTDHMTYVYDSIVHQIIIGLLYSYKLLIHMAAMFLALCTHDIKVKGLDDAKCIIAAVYFTTINLLLVTMTFYVLREYLITYTVMFTFLIFFSTTLILGLVFIPKMIALYKDPKGESIFDKYEPPSLKTQPAVLNGQPQTQQQQHTDQSTTCTGTIDSLKKRIQELENMLSLNQQQAELEEGPATTAEEDAATITNV